MHSPLRHRRSRLLPAFGQINPSKRPFGALHLNRDDVKENVATLELTPRPPQQMSVAMKPLPARPALFGFRDRLGDVRLCPRKQGHADLDPAPCQRVVEARVDFAELLKELPTRFWQQRGYALRDREERSR